MPDYDVIVVGAGNAAFAAALSAKENGAENVVVLEKAHKEMRGGNTHWSGSIFRIAFDEPRDLEPFLPGVEDEYLNFYEGISPYTKERFWNDLDRVTQGRTDRELAAVMIDNSYDTVKWAVETAKIP